MYKKILLIASTTAITAISCSSAYSATIVGSADFQNAGDNLLTVITTDTNETLEWLDLTETVEQSVNQAVANFSSDGFDVATVSQMNQLLNAFGYENLSGVRTTNTGLDPTLDDRFESFFGLTILVDPSGTNSSLGLFNGAEFNEEQGVFRTGSRRNEDTTFENYFGTLNNPFSGIAVYLVRTEQSEPVPEPVTIIGTLTALGFGRLFKKKYN